MTSSLERCGSGPNLDKLITLYNRGSDLGCLIIRLSGIAPNLEWLEIVIKDKIVGLQFDSRIIDGQDSLSGPYLIPLIWPVPTPTNVKPEGNAISQFQL